MKKKLYRCIHCGIGKTTIKNVEKILSFNNNTVLVNINAEVCDHCGERYYEPETVRYFERIKKELKSKDSKQLIPIGITYKVAI
ncbi:MAG: YgiT-type zinc finger protein [Leptospiraceae bacterium]|nr:YgiT-type zinc finger protein [Leptospiraceae bacterium]MCP5494850.1 YgiT-type zinc finger protein [Leptospiraceae bacterium]